MRLDHIRGLFFSKQVLENNIKAGCVPFTAPASHEGVIIHHKCALCKTVPVAFLYTYEPMVGKLEQFAVYHLVLSVLIDLTIIYSATLRGHWGLCLWSGRWVWLSPFLKRGTRGYVPTTGGSHSSASPEMSTPGYWRGECGC